MLKKLTFLFLTLTWLTPSQADTTQPASHADIVKQAAEKFMNENNVPGVVIELYVNGQPESYYFGYANPNLKIAMNKNTIFELGSISKVMTSILLAQEVDAARVQLDQPVKKYLPTLSEDFSEISLMNLATHTSGLPFNKPENIKSAKELNQLLATFYPDDVTNEHWVYSNLGIGVLGFALEKVTHKNINQLYSQRLLQPLRMQPIGMTVPKTLQAKYAAGYDQNGNAVPPMPPSLLPAAGAVKASAQDMQRFLSAAIGLPGTPEHILYPMRMTQSVYVELPTKMQGLGWEVHPLEANDVSDLLSGVDVSLDPVTVTEVYSKPRYSGDMLIDKTGMTVGFRTYIAVIPNKKTGIVILANKSIPGGAIVHTGREILFKLNNISPNNHTGVEQE